MRTHTARSARDLHRVRWAYFSLSIAAERPPPAGEENCTLALRGRWRLDPRQTNVAFSAPMARSLAVICGSAYACPTKTVPHACEATMASTLPQSVRRRHHLTGLPAVGEALANPHNSPGQRGACPPADFRPPRTLSDRLYDGVRVPRRACLSRRSHGDGFFEPSQAVQRDLRTGVAILG